MPARTLRAIALRLEDRLAALEARLPQQDDPPWAEYVATVTAYAQVVAQLAPDRFGAFLTTEQMAAKLNVAPKTLLKRKRRGTVTPAVQLGKRGRAAIRWKGTEAAR